MCLSVNKRTDPNGNIKHFNRNKREICEVVAQLMYRIILTLKTLVFVSQTKRSILKD